MEGQIKYLKVHSFLLLFLWKEQH